MLVHIVAECLFEQEVELAEVLEDDVPPDVPGEAGRVDEGARVSARLGCLLEDHPLLVPEPSEFAAAGETARPGTDDGDLFCSRARHRLPILRSAGQKATGAGRFPATRSQISSRRKLDFPPEVLLDPDVTQ